MRTLGNIVWFLFGGWLMALMWIIAALICFVSIIGIPMGVQCVKFAGFVLYPFGRTVIYSGRTLNFLVNILWILLLGWELALSSLVIGLIWCVTVIGIPFGLQCIKFAKLALMPFGAEIVKA